MVYTTYIYISLHVTVSIPRALLCICFTPPTNVNIVSKSLISECDTHPFGRLPACLHCSMERVHPQRPTAAQEEHSRVPRPGQLVCLGVRLAWAYELCFPLVCRFTPFPSRTRYNHFSQVTDLSCEVKYSCSAENYTIFHASISGAILYQFFF